MQAHEQAKDTQVDDKAKSEPEHEEASGGAGLPGPVRAKMEGAFGADFSGVRVHESGRATQMGAQAFAQGESIHFAPGQYDPSSGAGQRLLGHELAHVVQQRAGRVSKGPQGKGASVVEDVGLEHEADVMGDRAASGQKATVSGGGGAAAGGGHASLIQGKFIQLKPTTAAAGAAGAGSRAAQPGDVIDGYVVYPNEVRHGGTLAWINNNPGNIRPGSFTEGHGAYAGKSNHNFAIFPTEQQGFEAIRALLRTSSYQSKTILNAMKMYAPPTDGNDPVAYANTIHSLTGLDVNRAVSSLNDSEITQMANAIKRVEGTVAGQTFARNDSHLPQAVRTALGSTGTAAPTGGGAKAPTPPAHTPTPTATPKAGTDSGGGGQTTNQQGFTPAPSLAEVAAGHAVIKKGMEGPSVKHVQEKVHVTADGQFGPHTETAVKDFQRTHKLQVDGVVGSHTLATMDGHAATQPGTQPGTSTGGTTAGPGHATGPANGTSGQGTGQGTKPEVPTASGSDPVAIARRYVTHPPTASINLKGKLPHFTAAGGQTNDCADFVSSCLETAGRISGHHINVSEFERSLLAQGWKHVTKDQAMPGDVWMNASRGHTELVSGAHGSSLIGSNNDRPGHQVVTETQGWAGVFLQKHFGPAPAPATQNAAAPAHNTGTGQSTQPVGGNTQNHQAEATVRSEVLSKAETHLNAPYYWGASGPSMFDCSGFSWYVLHTDMHLTTAGRTNAQGLSGAPYTKPVSTPEKGDLVFYGGSGNISHVTIAAGSGSSTIGASGGGSHTHGDNPNAKVKFTDWTKDRRAKTFGSIKDLIAHKVEKPNS